MINLKDYLIVPQFALLFNDQEGYHKALLKLTEIKNDIHTTDKDGNELRKPWKKMNFVQMGLFKINNWASLHKEQFLEMYKTESGTEYQFEENLKPLPYKAGIVFTLDGKFDNDFEVYEDFSLYPNPSNPKAGWCGDSFDTKVYLWKFILPNVEAFGSCVIPYKYEHLKFHTERTKGWLYDENANLVEHWYEVGDCEIAIEPMAMQNKQK